MDGTVEAPATLGRASYQIETAIRVSRRPSPFCSERKPMFTSARPSILKHLQDLGYADEVRDLGPSCEGFSEELSGLVNQARSLTQRGQFNPLHVSVVVIVDCSSQSGTRFVQG